MSKIVRLSEQISNMIAAGEVVERPMGVVKELVENSIDAGSTSIEVRIEEGGIACVEVIDDGCGMSQEDAVNAFGRHATSKIKNIDDLWSIHTLGFRGEAIPSIASVSSFELTTSDGQEHTRVLVEYGKLMEAKPYPAKQGTHIKVKGLFYKTPARLKHLKSASVEANQVVDVMEKFAMSHPEIAFRLISDGNVRLSTSGSNQLSEIIYKIYGKEAAQNCVEMEASQYDFQVKGCLVLPHVTRATKYYMTVYINGRMIRNYYIQKAIQEGYTQYIAPDRYPICVLNILMDDKLVDVNVHPSKWEVRLSKDKQLCEWLKKTIQETLYCNMRVMEVNPSTLGKHVKEKIDVLSFMEQLDEPVLPVTPVEEQKKMGPISPSSSVMLKDSERAYGDVKLEIQEEKESYQSHMIIEEEIVQDNGIGNLRVIGQLWGKYILAQSDNSLFIIDQHAAEEKINYERFLKELDVTTFATQELLVPIVLELRPSTYGQLDAINEKLACIGLHLERFGGNSVCVKEVPLWMGKVKQQEFLNDLIDQFDGRVDWKVKDIKKDTIATIACHASIKFNRYLTQVEMEKVIHDLRLCKQPFHCPHGRPTLMQITDQQLLKEFKRE